MKQTFRFSIENKTDRQIRVFPLDRILLPRDREVFEVEFSKPLRLRLDRLQHTPVESFATTVRSLYPYGLDFKLRSRRYVWKIKVEESDVPRELTQSAPPVSCVVSTSENGGTKNVETGQPD